MKMYDPLDPHRSRQDKGFTPTMSITSLANWYKVLCEKVNIELMLSVAIAVGNF